MQTLLLTSGIHGTFQSFRLIYFVCHRFSPLSSGEASLPSVVLEAHTEYRLSDNEPCKISPKWSVRMVCQGVCCWRGSASMPDRHSSHTELPQRRDGNGRLAAQATRRVSRSSLKFSKASARTCRVLKGKQNAPIITRRNRRILSGEPGNLEQLVEISSMICR